MNKKGEVNNFGVIMVVFIAILVGVILFQVIAQQVGETTNTITIANESLGSAAVISTTQYFTNYRSLTDVVVFNATEDAIVPAGNYTIANNVVYNGALAVSITPSTYLNESGYDSGVWTISGTAQPLTYIPDSGGRAMASLIVIFFALLVAVVALEPTLRSGVLSAFGK